MALPTFETLFSRSPAASSNAPGRINLIGEHTDYNGGFGLPTATPQRTTTRLAPRADDQVFVWSDAACTGAADVLSFRTGQETARHNWLDYIQGVTDQLLRGGHPLTGFEAHITSTVPLGSGLSSSASLTVSILRALRTACRLSLTDLEIARLGQQVENDFVGARVGIMDPMAASLADQGTALFLDAQTLDFERIALPRSFDLVVIHSGITHRLTTGGYNTRRAECEQACRLLGIGSLRELNMHPSPGRGDAVERIPVLPEPLNRRVRHIVTENQRVLNAVGAIREENLPFLGRLFKESHASMRDDYEVSVPEVDLLVDLACAHPDVLGARLTGGGFGGSVIILVEKGSQRTVAGQIAGQYAARSGCQPRILVPC
jgi:galactokinase